MAVMYPIKLEDITIKRVDIASGPSIIRTHFTILCRGKELGSVTSGQKIALGCFFETIFLYRKWGCNTEIAYTIFDAVRKILHGDCINGASRRTIEGTYELLFNEGLTL